MFDLPFEGDDMATRILAVLIYYIGGIAVCVGLGVSFGLRGDPRWYAFIAPAFLVICLLGIRGPDAPMPPTRAALLIGGLGLIGAIVGYMFGPALVV
ncbi:hypothetical protein DM806_13680 [Sphingobium lactosutens]|uniref:hypothetical protein n=1 Tax=Sphingobium lactosutens TaxID=522773 RepID=UPI0015C13D50|nr:hypothetical protein [Sphingobium lactosutens]NWK96691.1 hypothetical protein [Sphingobium lactosutens]